MKNKKIENKLDNDEIVIFLKQKLDNNIEKKLLKNNIIKAVNNI